MRLLLVLVAVVLTAVPSLASVPPVISYQGKLTQPTGAPVPDGSYSITFSIYDTPSGGSHLWTETNSSVQVTGGLFRVLMGSVLNLSGNIFESPNRWLAIKVGDDAEMTPRQRIASVAYAQVAEKANSVADGVVTAAKLAADSVTTEKVSSGAITADKLASGIAMPPGAVIMWSGTASAIPIGWSLCDGTKGTPDLRGRFIIGVGSYTEGTNNLTYSLGNTGGEAFHKLTEAELASHWHWEYASNSSGFGGTDGTISGSGWDMGSHWGGYKTDSTGGDQPHENRPPYYALCLIMKTGY